MSDIDQGFQGEQTRPRDPVEIRNEEPAAVEREEPKEPDTVAKLLEEMFIYLSDRMERTTQRQPHDHGKITSLVQRLRAIE